MMKSTTVRFTDKQFKALESMAWKKGATKSDVVCSAFALLEVAIKARGKGQALGIIKDDVVIKEIVVY